ncbi:uncharacterized protein [Typha latifolia]|uniref:uncharacterized protein isoform X1 n=1 Tax=Typha latifolia TaxID=4733 RepID=UPI003C2D17B1
MDASLDLSSTQRIILLIDLHPLLSLQDPSSYISSILSAAQKIISFPPLSSSISAFKLFFSSISPILSTSNVHRLLGKSPTFLSFDRPHQTLDSLAKSLNSLLAIPDLGVSGSPRASLLARSLLQLEHDYGWQTHSENPKGTRELLQFRSNLVVLFSSLSKDSRFLAEYVESVTDVDGSVTFDAFLKRFVQVFRPVKERLIPRDIHLCLLDVNYGSEGDPEISRSGWLERGIRELSWGYCSTDAIVLGSVLVPFGLLYPYIGCSMGHTLDRGSKNGHAEFVLGIADASGKPLECTGCNLEVLDLKLLSERTILSFPFLKDFCSKITKVRVTQVWKKEKGEKFIKNAAALTILRGFSGNCRKYVKQHTEKKFFADRVFESLCLEKGEIKEHKPVWQLLLAFLYGRSYCAVVSMSDSDGNSVEGILLPFTINYVAVHIIEKGCVDLFQSASSITDGLSEVLDSSINGASKDKNARRKRNKLQEDLLQSTTWSSFRGVLLSYANDTVSGVDLDELYLSRGHTNSKKLRFLKCWMSQSKSYFSSGCQINQPEAKEHINVIDEAGRVVPSEEEAGVNLMSSSTDEADATYRSMHGKDASAFSCLDDLEAFLGSIHQKIEQGLHSEDADLGILAERLVGLSVLALYRKLEGNTIKNSDFKEADGAYDAKVASEVFHLLLRKPKDLILKYKGVNPASAASASSSANYSTEYKIREHELQMCFRMEILQSDVRASIEENMKQKMIKEICTLLQFVDINLQGHSFHAENVVEFAQRTIKSRYNHSLEAVVQKIYNKMEFDLFVEVEASDSLHNSNDDEFKNSNSNGRIHKNSVGPTSGVPIYQATHQEDVKVHHCMRDHKHEQQLIRAQERRNRDRRFSSFTSWVPDLHRVWAIKKTRTEKPICEPLPKPFKRRKRTAVASDMVCETPMTGTKHSNEQKDAACSEIKSCKSLPKALFRHEGDLGSSIIS